MTLGYQENQPTREAVDAMPGEVALEFGANWCGICRTAKPLLDEAFAARPQVQRIQAEDAKGRPLGRSFTVRLWPTVILMRDGVEVARVVRPKSSADLDEAFAQAGMDPA